MTKSRRDHPAEAREAPLWFSTLKLLAQAETTINSRREADGKAPLGHRFGELYIEAVRLLDFETAAGHMGDWDQADIDSWFENEQLTWSRQASK